MARKGLNHSILTKFTDQKTLENFLSFTAIFYRRKSSLSPVKLKVICLRSIQTLKEQHRIESSATAHVSLITLNNIKYYLYAYVADFQHAFVSCTNTCTNGSWQMHTQSCWKYNYLFVINFEQIELDLPYTNIVFILITLNIQLRQIRNGTKRTHSKSCYLKLFLKIHVLICSQTFPKKFYCNAIITTLS